MEPTRRRAFALALAVAIVGTAYLRRRQLLGQLSGPFAYSPRLEAAPPGRATPQRPPFGRYRHALKDARAACTLEGPLAPLRLKQWHYVSLVTNELFLGLAVASLGFAGTAFAYVVDRASGRCVEYTSLSPLALAAGFAPSSVAGTTSWAQGSNRVSLTAAESGDGSCRVELALDAAGTPITADFTYAPGSDESLALLFPLAGGSRPAYTHKASGLVARGRVAVGTEERVFEDGLCATDWTRSYALRFTRWNWLSLAHRLANGTRVGLNLSKHVYDWNGTSQENVLFLDGKAYPLEAVDFAVPEDCAKGVWKIRSRQLDLEFRGLGAREEHHNFGLVKDDFVQPFGVFTGTITPVSGISVCVDGAFGVVEEHFALW